MRKVFIAIVLVALTVTLSVVPDKPAVATGICSGCMACSGGYHYCAFGASTCYWEKSACEQ